MKNQKPAQRQIFILEHPGNEVASEKAKSVVIASAADMAQLMLHDYLRSSSGGKQDQSLAFHQLYPVEHVSPQDLLTRYPEIGAVDLSQSQVLEMQFPVLST